MREAARRATELARGSLRHRWLPGRTAAQAGLPGSALGIYSIVPHTRVNPPVARRDPPLPLEDPQELRARLSAKLASQVFPILDSRTRYWRYYLLIGPRQQWGATSLGPRCFRILRDNPGGNRGIGRRLKRWPGSKAHRAVVKSLKTQYGPAVKRFWQVVSDSRRDGGLLAASERIRTGSLRGFFDSKSDLHARRSFHRMLRTQTGEAGMLAGAFLRKESLHEAVLEAMSRSRLSEPVRRVLLTYAILRCLYQPPDARSRALGLLDDDDDDVDSAADSAALGRMARVALRWLREGRIAALAPPERARLRGYLLSGFISGGTYIPPLPSPSPRRNRDRINVFAGLRLGAFHRLLRSTR